jgi:hypothetical protein
MGGILADSDTWCRRGWPVSGGNDEPGRVLAESVDFRETTDVALHPTVVPLHRAKPGSENLASTDVEPSEVSVVLEMARQRSLHPPDPREGRQGLNTVVPAPNPAGHPNWPAGQSPSPSSQVEPRPVIRDCPRPPALMVFASGSAYQIVQRIGGSEIYVLPGPVAENWSAVIGA